MADRPGADPDPQTSLLPQIVQDALPGLLEVARRLLRPRNLREVLEEILDQIVGLFGYRIAAVLLVDEPARELYIEAHRSVDPAFAVTRRFRIGTEGIVGHVAATGEAFYAPDVRREPRYVEGAAGVRSELALPLVVDGRVIGVLDVESTAEDDFPPTVRAVLEAFATLAALAIVRARRDDELTAQALRDGLTGLVNHRGLWEALQRELARMERTGEEVAVVLFEVDRFKQVNDRYGHLAGDAVLRAVADVLRTSSRGMDLAARFGGDEFVTVLPRASSAVAVEVADRIRRRIAALDVQGIRVTVSAGVAVAPEHGRTPDDLLEAADRAMYAAKRAGGNLVGTPGPAIVLVGESTL